MTFQRTSLTQHMPLAACAAVRAHGFDRALRGLWISQTRGGVNPKSSMAFGKNYPPGASENLKGSA